MLKDRIEIDLPLYDGLLAGHYVRGPGYGRRRPGGTDDWLLVMTLSGQGRFSSESGDVAALAPSLYLIAPGTTHDYGTARDADDWEILWVHFQPPSTWLDLLQWPVIAPGIHSLEPSDSQEIESTFREVCRHSVSSSPRRRQYAMNALERLLLECDAQHPSVGRQMDDRIRAVIEYIHGHLRFPLTLADLSGKVNLSPSRFAHLFREETGIAPRQYVLLQRLNRARSLLERTTLSVSEVAAEVGMDPFYLSIRFKAVVGKSPKTYRRSRLNIRSV